MRKKITWRKVVLGPFSSELRPRIDVFCGFSSFLETGLSVFTCGCISRSIRRTSFITMATLWVKRKHPPLNSPGDASITCPICLDPIIDATEDSEGQGAVFCEGKCDAWLHRQCAGLSQRLFKLYHKGDDPFHCPNCRLNMQELQIQQLKSTIESLHKEVSELKSYSKDTTVENWRHYSICI